MMRWEEIRGEVSPERRKRIDAIKAEFDDDIDWGEEPEIETSCDLENPESCASCQ